MKALSCSFSFFKNKGVEVGRDGCRVPIPWTTDGPSFGFGEAEPHLPQPEDFGSLSVAAQEGNEESTLELYRQALALRKELQSEESLEWLDSAEGMLAFSRPNGWISVTNFSAEPQLLPEGTLLLSSAPLDDAGRLPAATTAWLRGN